ncbi:hypothetical protein F5Y10DRAFT_234878 [Nemania abortiva]|nr:hypothetical protein F5Y10DRAFT_234878 [Nemania abortiva]
MSGLEIAGLVLGALPLAITAVQSYRNALRSISTKNVKRDLDYMERDLQTEQLRLQNTCETLLVGIVPPFKIHLMIEDPFGPEWKTYADKLRLRLYTSYDTFDNCINEMSTATEELRLQLGIEEGSQIDSRDRKSILEALKRNTSFTLKRKEYDGILSRIKAGNATLQDLSRENRGLEPDRRRRSQSRVTSLLRGLSQSIYNALCSAITCTCIDQHSIGLQLSQRDAIMLPSDMEEIVARKFAFPITLKVANETNSGLMQNHSNLQIAAQWRKFQLRLLDDDKNPPDLATLSPSSASSSHKPKVKWLPSVIKPEPRKSPDLPGTQTSTSLNISLKSIEPRPQRILDLCGVSRKGPKAPAAKCHGYVLDIRRKFMLSTPDDNAGTHKQITLRQVIDGKFPDLPPFGFEERLRVALVLSISLLHLNGTPWLAQMLVLDVIVFMTENEESTSQPPYLLYRPFVIKGVLNKPALCVPTPNTVPPTTPPTTPTPLNSPTQALGPVRPINLAVLSLGAILAQIIIGRVDGQLSIADTIDPSSIISMRKRGSQLEEEILVSGGMNYAEAVKWCLDSTYRVAGLQDERFCQEFYEAVIGRLEDDLKTIAPDG